MHARTTSSAVSPPLELFDPITILYPFDPIHPPVLPIRHLSLIIILFSLSSFILATFSTGCSGSNQSINQPTQSTKPSILHPPSSLVVSPSSFH
jgi:hypothetical protein